MNALVGYGSSDEEEDDVLPQRPAKVGICQYHKTAKIRIPTNDM